MEILINVTSPEGQDVLIARGGMSKIGSAANCELRINHPEIAAHAASVELRGKSILFQNKNDFPVYLGQTEVLPGSWLQWEDQTIQLSRSISLKIAEVRQTATGSTVTGDEEAKAPGEAQKKVVQMMIIGVCLAGSIFMLSSDDGPANTSKERFRDLIEVLNDREQEAKRKGVQDVASFNRLRRRLQEAWISDLRWRDTNPDLVVDFYQLLLNVPEIENCQEDSLEFRIKDFAKHRLETIKIFR